MKHSRLISRGACLLLIAALLLIFCSAGHDCHGAMEDHCPVCLVLAAWRLAMPGALALVAICFAGKMLHFVSLTAAELGEKVTLVALKVKLSD